MAKRFTETEKWKNNWFRSLPSKYKLLWLYIIDDCNHAGIWRVNIDITKTMIQEEVSLEEAEILFEDRIVKLSPYKWFIIPFIEFQYGKINLESSNNKVHKSVLNILEKEKIIDLGSPIDRASIGYPRGIDGVSKGLGRGMDTPKDKEEEKEAVEIKKKVYDIMSKIIKSDL